MALRTKQFRFRCKNRHTESRSGGMEGSGAISLDDRVIDSVPAALAAAARVRVDNTPTGIAIVDIACTVGAIAVPALGACWSHNPVLCQMLCDVCVCMTVSTCPGASTHKAVSFRTRHTESRSGGVVVAHSAIHLPHASVRLIVANTTTVEARACEAIKCARMSKTAT